MKNITFYHLRSDFELPVDIESRLEKTAFSPCVMGVTATTGFVPVLTGGKEYAHMAKEVLVMALDLEDKKVSRQAIAIALDERLKKIIGNDDRVLEPYDPEYKRIKLSVQAELESKCIANRRRFYVVIDKSQGFLAINTHSKATCDRILKTVLVALGENPAIKVEFNAPTCLTDYILKEKDNVSLADHLKLEGKSFGVATFNHAVVEDQLKLIGTTDARIVSVSIQAPACNGVFKLFDTPAKASLIMPKVPHDNDGDEIPENASQNEVAAIKEAANWLLTTDALSRLQAFVFDAFDMYGGMPRGAVPSN